MKRQIHIYYSGRVQGVGFRFTAQNLAEKFCLTGWVKNLADGRVEILAEGDDESLKSYLGEISRYFKNYIANVDIIWQDAEGLFKDFRVKL